MRSNHCGSKKLNSNGRCIAYCHFNIQSDVDCTGKAGATCDQAEGKEMYVSGGWIDGRGVEVDDKGYKIIPKSDDSLKAVTQDADSKVETDSNGWKFIWTTTPGGIRYKKYYGPNGVPIT